MRLSTSLLLLATSLLGAVMPPPARAQTNAGAIQSLLDQQAAAWNRADGNAWAASFTDDADFVNIRGDLFLGRQAIAAQHVRILTGPYAGTHAAIVVRRFTEPAPGVALIETDYTVSGVHALPSGVQPTEAGVLKTRMKYIAVKQGDGWHFVAAQNTVILPPPQSGAGK